MNLLTGVLALLIVSSVTLAAEREVADAVVAPNPAPETLPGLSAYVVEWSPGRHMRMVRISAPNIPDFVCDVWCYESAIDVGVAEAGEDGSLVLRQRSTRGDGREIVTLIIPEPGGVTFEVAAAASSPEDAARVPPPNPCWQLIKAPGFCSAPDPFPEFVNRCFVFTEAGCVSMGATKRFPDTRQPADDPRNNPPWVQVYIPVWREHPGQPKAFWGNSTDRYVYPLLGCRSRDGKYVAAMGTGKNSSICQGWHDCLHPCPVLDYDADLRQANTRFKLYLMENDAEELLRRYLADFKK